MMQTEMKSGDRVRVTWTDSLRDRSWITVGSEYTLCDTKPGDLYSYAIEGPHGSPEWLMKSQVVAVEVTECFVCSREEHAPTDHDFLSVADASAWYDRQPNGAPTVMEIDGTPHSYAL